MKLFILALTASAVLEATSMNAQMLITRDGSRPMVPAPAADFTGTARVEMLFEPADGEAASGGSVTFERGR
jgi:4-carboxymuconolactone decarboxylase